MKRLVLLAAAVCVAACGKPDNEPEPSPMPSAEVAQKDAVYKSLVPSVADAAGAVDTYACDSGHWTFLRAALGDEVNVLAFFDDGGRLHRRPVVGHKECFPDESDSMNSADEFLYLITYAVARGDLAVLEKVFAYGRANTWIMGDGDRFRTVLRPSLIGVLARAIKHLGGPSHPERFFPNPQGALFVTDGDIDAYRTAFLGGAVFPAGWTLDGERGFRLLAAADGFEAQLQVVSILVDARVSGGATDMFVQTLREQKDRQPNNALFACAASRYGQDDVARADALLRNEAWWPADRLPTSADRCESMLTQRDEGNSWLPCPEENRTHPGIDFRFAAAVCAGLL